MILDRHASIISDDINGIFLNNPGGKVPVTGIPDVRLLQLSPVQQELPPAKFNLLAFECDDALEKHDPVPCKTNGYHIMPSRFREKIPELPAEVETPVMIIGFHTDSLDMERNAQVAKKQV